MWYHTPHMLIWGGGKTEKWKNDECGIIHHKCLFLNWGGGKTEKLKNDELGIIHHKCLFGVEGRL